MSTTNLSSANQTLVTNATVQQQALLAERAALDAERLSIVRQSPLTAAQTTRVAEIDNRLNQISISSAALTATPTDNTLPVEDLTKTAAKAELAKQVTLTVPSPPKGSYTIVHGNVQKGDLISYMKFTQYLNPYGRKRQCDIDLENLMIVINKDMNNQIAEYKELAKEITNVAGS